MSAMPANGLSTRGSSNRRIQTTRSSFDGRRDGQDIRRRQVTPSPSSRCGSRQTCETSFRRSRSRRRLIYREGVNPEEAAWVASKIPGAKLVPLSGHRWVVWMGDLVELGDAVEAFLRSIRAEQAEFERVLATVLFTDIVDSTAQAASARRPPLEGSARSTRPLDPGALARYRGREVKTMGDGFLATFDGPARAVRCAQSIVNGVRSLGVDVRAGLHTGEVELDGVDVAGIGVAIGARVGALAGPSEVLVSSTVKDLVVGSDLSFEDAGEHELKGVPGRWHLYRVVEE